MRDESRPGWPSGGHIQNTGPAAGQQIHTVQVQLRRREEHAVSHLPEGSSAGTGTSRSTQKSKTGGFR